MRTKTRTISKGKLVRLSDDVYSLLCIRQAEIIREKADKNKKGRTTFSEVIKERLRGSNDQDVDNS